MPGILYYLAFGEVVYDKLSETRELDKSLFMSGNLIPDLAKDKKRSHYRIKGSQEGFFVPDMKAVKKDLYNPDNPILLGMYCHLYLDYYFIEEFLIPEFIWDEKDMMVINPRNNKKWDVPTFFSQKGMYGSYTEINQMMIRDGRVSQETLSIIPDVLPDTGIAVYDDRREKTWRQELNEYFAEKKEYTGDIFDYGRLWTAIENISKKFCEEIS